MEKVKDIYLTNKEYHQLLLLAQENLNKIETVTGEDSTSIGNKYTITNIGLCNDEIVPKELSMFPEDYPRRKGSKYRLSNHKCPLDKREHLDDLSNGCFYSCRFFQDSLRDIKVIQKLYKECIEEIHESHNREMSKL